MQLPFLPLMLLLSKSLLHAAVNCPVVGLLLKPPPYCSKKKLKVVLAKLIQQEIFEWGLCLLNKRLEETLCTFYSNQKSNKSSFPACVVHQIAIGFFKAGNVTECFIKERTPRGLVCRSERRFVTFCKRIP